MLRTWKPILSLVRSTRLQTKPTRSGFRSSDWALAARNFSTDVDITSVGMPSLSPTMAAGVIAEWRAKPGQSLAAGDALCDIETDKAQVAFEDDCVLAKILVEAKGEEIPIGSPMALIVEDEAAYQAFLKLDPSTYANLLGSSADNAETSKKSAENTSSSVADSESSLATGEKPRLSPAARHMAESQSLDISKLRGTSKKGLISKRDLVMGLKDGTVTIQHASRQKDDIASASEQSIQPKEKKQPPSQPSSVAQKIDYAVDSAPINSRYVDIPNSNMRKVIAKRLSESKATVPHFYTTVECEIDELLTLRKALKKDFDVNISVNDLVIKSAAMALRDVPEANAKWNAKTQSVTPSDGVDVSVAVATPNGLITPIVKGASRRGLSDINSTVKDLAGRARLGKLSPEEYQGGSFSISNLGMFGISSFSAVINPPQACILAVGSGVSRIVPSKPKDGGKPMPRVVTTVTVQLSGDRRVVDEALAAQYLQVFRQYLSDPKTLML